jgi:hypothetical protein
MLDKRTPRSQNFKKYQLQHQHQQSFSKSDALPQPFFDFALADLLSANIHELLKATILFLDAIQIVFSLQFVRLCVKPCFNSSDMQQSLALLLHPSSVVQLNISLSHKDLLPQPSPTAASPDILDASSSLQLPSVSSSSTINDDISSLLEISDSQLESQCFLI